MGSKKYRKHLCAFIDILGYKNLVETVDKSSNPMLFIKKLESLIQKGITSYIKFMNESPKKLCPDKSKEFNYEIFSDSIIITTSIEDDISEGDFTRKLICLCLILAEIQVESMQYGIIYRGGISIGNHYKSKNILFSKALVNAYLTESEEARYPRIVVDTIHNEDNYLTFPRVLETLLEAELLIKDDNCYFVDYVYRLKRYGYRYVEKHKKYIETNLVSNKETTKVLEKYIWLAEYHNYKMINSWKDYRININETVNPCFEGRTTRTSFVETYDEENNLEQRIKLVPGQVIKL